MNDGFHTFVLYLLDVLHSRGANMTRMIHRDKHTTTHTHTLPMSLDETTRGPSFGKDIKSSEAIPRTEGSRGKSTQEARLLNQNLHKLSGDDRSDRWPRGTAKERTEKQEEKGKATTTTTKDSKLPQLEARDLLTG